MLTCHNLYVQQIKSVLGGERGRKKMITLFGALLLDASALVLLLFCH